MQIDLSAFSKGSWVRSSLQSVATLGWDGMDFKVVGHSMCQSGLRVLSLKEINVALRDLVSSHENGLS